MSQKKSVIIYRDWKPFFESLPSEDVKKIILYLFDVSAYESGDLTEPPIYTGTEASKPIANFMKLQIENNETKYKERCEKNRKNVSKRWKKED